METTNFFTRRSLPLGGNSLKRTHVYVPPLSRARGRALRSSEIVDEHHFGCGSREHWLSWPASLGPLIPGQPRAEIC
jgi:hypothetical protein